MATRYDKSHIAKRLAADKLCLLVQTDLDSVYTWFCSYLQTFATLSASSGLETGCLSAGNLCNHLVIKKWLSRGLGFKTELDSLSAKTFGGIPGKPLIFLYCKEVAIRFFFPLVWLSHHPVQGLLETFPDDLWFRGGINLFFTERQTTMTITSTVSTNLKSIIFLIWMPLDA